MFFGDIEIDKLCDPKKKLKKTYPTIINKKQYPATNMLHHLISKRCGVWEISR
jgi:hypothetical protein